MTAKPPLPVIPGDENATSLAVRVFRLHTELKNTTSDFRRLQIRDEARAAAAAAAILRMDDIRLAASELVARAERLIVKHNPAQPGGRGKKTVTPAGKVSRKVLSEMRVTHAGLDDAQFEERVQEHHQLGVPITRKSLRDGPCAPSMKLRSGRDEWWTPRPVVEAARHALGRIDLDVASCPKADEIVRASRFFDRATDGLQQIWSGRVWMNPPFTVGIVGQFVDKLISEEETTSWCCLLNNGTETAWGQKILAHAHVVCFPASRIRFHGPDARREGTPTQGQMVLGWWRIAPAEGIARFREAFSPIGVVLPGGASLAREEQRSR